MLTKELEQCAGPIQQEDVYPLESLNHAYIWLFPLLSLPRYRKNGQPYSYMENHRENVFEHVLQCVDYAVEVFEKNPRIREVLNVKKIFTLLWIHEAGEIAQGKDISWDEQLNLYGLAAIGGGEGENKDEIEDKARLRATLDSLFHDDHLSERWSSIVYDFDNFRNSKDPEVLFAKLIDCIVGNRTVLLFGNNLAERATSQMDTVGERFRLLTMNLFNSSLMMQNPDIFHWIQNEMVLPQVRQYRQKGLLIPYEVKLYALPVNNN